MTMLAMVYLNPQSDAGYLPFFLLFYVWAAAAAVPNGDEVLSGLEALQAQGVVTVSRQSKTLLSME